MVFIQFHQSIILCQFYTLKPHFLSNYWEPITQIQCFMEEHSNTTTDTIPTTQTSINIQFYIEFTEVFINYSLLLKLSQNLTLTYDQIDSTTQPNMHYHP